jgi:hypothetical protein
MLKRLVVLVLIVLGFSCKEVEIYPKPEAKLALEYPTPIAHQYKNDRFEFSYNEEALLMPTSKQSF